MRRRISTALLAAMLLTPLVAQAQNQGRPAAQAGKAPAQGRVELKTATQQASYGIGMNFGSQIAEAGLDVDALVQGIRDALSKAEPALTDEQLEKAMTEFSKQMEAKAQARGQEAIKEGDAFLAANAKKEGVKTTESGLQYKVLKSGTGASPKATSVVKVHYHGTFPDGKKFDSSIDRGEPAEFPVNRVIPGWTEALQMMKVGDKWQLAIPAKLAYGEQGRPGIPPNQVLLFDVELLDIVKQ
jgi:FKBP-type peptidyl-prolyl cis-trans isomerase FklB